MCKKRKEEEEGRLNLMMKIVVEACIYFEQIVNRVSQVLLLLRHVVHIIALARTAHGGIIVIWSDAVSGRAAARLVLLVVVVIDVSHRVLLLYSTAAAA
jgi:hypothetical protein